MPPTLFLLKATFILNLLDGFLTILFVNLGVVTEANPMMGWLLNYSLLTFVGFKILVVGFLVSYLEVYCDNPIVEKGAVLLFAFYLLVNLVHAYIISLLCFG